MAKLRVEFKDELGSNLSRFKIIRSDGTSEIVTLNRNASVTQRGTPLNSENMNKVKDSINSLYDKKYIDLEYELSTGQVPKSGGSVKLGDNTITIFYGEVTPADDGMQKGLSVSINNGAKHCYVGMYQVEDEYYKIQSRIGTIYGYPVFDNDTLDYTYYFDILTYNDYIEDLGGDVQDGSNYSNISLIRERYDLIATMRLSNDGTLWIIQEY